MGGVTCDALRYGRNRPPPPWFFVALNPAPPLGWGIAVVCLAAGTAALARRRLRRLRASGLFGVPPGVFEKIEIFGY